MTDQIVEAMRNAVIERDRLREENDQLRAQVTLLRAVLTRLNKADHSTLLWIFDVKEITADALAATEPKP